MMIEIFLKLFCGKLSYCNLLRAFFGKFHHDVHHITNKPYKRIILALALIDIDYEGANDIAYATKTTNVVAASDDFIYYGRPLLN